MRTDAPPDVAEVRRIAAVANPVLRNLRITDAYSRLAAAVAVRSGEGANWCTFATWASRQAGRTIRGEDWTDQLARRLAHGRSVLHPVTSLWSSLLQRGLFQPETRLGRLTGELHTPFDAFELASDAVARGNLKVFAEIGLEFARYLAACPPDTPPGSPAVERFLDGLRPGEPPDGQRYLRQAFERLERSRHEADPRARAELAFLANLEIGLHEQTRLQPEIREALDAPSTTSEDLGRRLLEALHPAAAGWRAGLRRPSAAALGLLGPSAQRAASELAREVITDCFMVLSLPGRVLALGVDLRDPAPELLRSPADPDLLELLGRFEPLPPAVDDCAVRDWSELPQRMHYIVHLFRAFHEAPDLYRPPFTPAQLASLARGTLPTGEL